MNNDYIDERNGSKQIKQSLKVILFYLQIDIIIEMNKEIGTKQKEKKENKKVFHIVMFYVFVSRVSSFRYCLLSRYVWVVSCESIVVLKLN